MARTQRAPMRKPQINFQVSEPLKALYDEAKAGGHSVARLCAAGLLLMVSDPAARQEAISRLREWEEQFADASAEQIRAFVDDAQAAMRSGARGNPRGRAAPLRRKTAGTRGSG